MHIFSGDVPTRLHGWSLDVPAGSEGETVLFLPPVGPVNCYHVGHPEPVTLPRRFPEAHTVTLKGGLSEQPLNDLAIWLARLRLTDTPAKRDAMGQIIKSLLPVLRRFGQPDEPCSAVRVDVKGWSNGEERQVSYGAVGPMKQLTGLPLAIGALMLARGEIHAPGVIAPEGCIEPEPFLAELETRGVHVRDLSDQRPATTKGPAKLSLAKPAFIAAGALVMLWWLVRRRRSD
jgi:saccharopine dehydrogenase-like NADP-dependent oxidoreductase